MKTQEKVNISIAWVVAPPVDPPSNASRQGPTPKQIAGTTPTLQVTWPQGNVLDCRSISRNPSKRALFLQTDVAMPAAKRPIVGPNTPQLHLACMQDVSRQMLLYLADVRACDADEHLAASLFHREIAPDFVLLRPDERSRQVHPRPALGLAAQSRPTWRHTGGGPWHSCSPLVLRLHWSCRPQMLNVARPMACPRKAQPGLEGDYLVRDSHASQRGQWERLLPVRIIRYAWETRGRDAKERTKKQTLTLVSALGRRLR